MPKKVTIFVTFLLSLFLFSGTAAALTLDNIGSMNTAGSSYAEWWYAGTNPTFRGTAGSSKIVYYELGETTGQTNADGAGNWSVDSSLGQGDYTVAFSSEGDLVAFTLHVGQDFPGGLGGAPEGTAAVPSTGSNQVMGIVILAVTTLAAFVYYKNSRKIAMASFEKKASKS